MKYILDHLKSMHSKLFINKLNVYIFYLLITLGYLFYKTSVFNEIPEFLIYAIFSITGPGIFIGYFLVVNLTALYEHIFYTPSPTYMPGPPSDIENFFIAIIFVLYAIFLSRVTANIYLRIKSSLKKNLD